MRIIGPASASRESVRDRLAVGTVTAHARFVAEMFEPLWAAALRYAVDPVGVVAQSLKETGGGAFPRKVQPWFYNTCGLRVRHVVEVQRLLNSTDGEHPLTHQMFTSWTEGARAHAQHLRAYAGCPVPADEVVDPRYHLVIDRLKLENFEDLGGRWAPSPTYGVELVQLANQLRDRT